MGIANPKRSLSLVLFGKMEQVLLALANNSKKSGHAEGRSAERAVNEILNEFQIIWTIGLFKSEGGRNGH
jgi:hypothetical protein